MGWLMRLVFGISAASGVAFGGVPFGYRSSPLHVEGQKVSMKDADVVLRYPIQRRKISPRRMRPPLVGRLGKAST